MTASFHFQKLFAFFMAALLLNASNALAQSPQANDPPAESSTNSSVVNEAEASEPTTLRPVSIQGSADGPQTWSAPGHQTPASFREVPVTEQKSVRDLTTTEASVTDTYNSTGYFDQLSIRGFTLDNQSSYWREGLPINAETVLGLENKEALQIYKGVSGLQAGVGRPGGLVNYQVKRPTGQKNLAGKLGFSEANNALIAIDANATDTLRLNAAAEQLSPEIQNSHGSRYLLAAAYDFKVSDQTKIAFEIETSRQSQPSQAAFSLWGDTLPELKDPRQNLNHQSWSQPVVFENHFATLQFDHTFNDAWSGSASLGGQITKTDDHLAYPFGCSSENRFDRFCSDGTFDVYDYRSLGEDRKTQALKLELNGEIITGFGIHKLRFGVLGSHATTRVDPQAYNFVGVDSVQAPTALPEDPRLTSANTSTEKDNADLTIQDHWQLDDVHVFAGARHTQIRRQSVRTDGTRATDTRDSFLLPSAALGYDFTPGFLYLSYAEGTEAFTTPNRPIYTRPGESLTDVKNQQWELGFKSKDAPVTYQLALFQIERARVLDQAPLFQTDGLERNIGAEADITYLHRNLRAQASVLKIQSRTENADLTPALNGQTTVNMPDFRAKASVGHAFPRFFESFMDLQVVHESSRFITPENTLKIPAWTVLNLAGSLKIAKGTRLQLKAENVFDLRYWRESPTQYAHLYLYPGAERRIGVQLEWNL